MTNIIPMVTVLRRAIPGHGRADRVHWHALAAHAVRATRAARAGQTVTPGSGAGASFSGVSPDGALAPARKRQESQASYDWGSPRTQARALVLVMHAACAALVVFDELGLCVHCDDVMSCDRPYTLSHAGGRCSHTP